MPRLVIVYRHSTGGTAVASGADGSREVFEFASKKPIVIPLTCVLLFVARKLVHVATDLCTQAVDDLVQSLGAARVHVDEELVLFVYLGRPGLDVRQVDALLLHK